jgi:cell division protein FtsA
MEKYIAAIDLGTTKVVTLIGRRSAGGRVHVLASSETPSQGIMRGEVVNIPRVVASIRHTVEDVQAISGIPVQEVYVGIAGQHIRCMENSSDTMRKNGDMDISESEIEEIGEKMLLTGIEEGEKILHVIPQSYNVDDICGITSTDVVGMRGKRLKGNYRIVIGKSTSANYTNECIERAGLKLKQLILEPLASAQAVLSDDEKEVGVAIVDIGGGTTDLVVYWDKIVRHTAVIPFGGNVITDDIRQGCGVLQHQANAMKEQHGSCYSDLVNDSVLVVQGVDGRESREISFQHLARIIEARMEEIIEAVMFEIEKSGYLEKLPAGIVFTGGGAMIQHLEEFVRSKTGLPARVAKPLNITDDSPGEVRRSSYSTAVGLLLKGMEHEEKIPVAVLPPPPPLEPVEVEDTGKSPKPKKEKKKNNVVQNLTAVLFPDLFNNDV